MASITSYILDPQFMGSVMTAVAVGATVITIALPLLDKNEFKSRMKTVAIERESIRQRERGKLAALKGNTRAGLRVEPKNYMKQLVELLNLKKNASTENSKSALAQAGYRGASAEYTFLFFRFVMPVALFVISLFYIFVVLQVERFNGFSKFGMAIAGAYLGFKGPEIFLKNQAQKRQLSMKLAFPDALDLLLICVESGMSVEQAFRRVSGEIAAQSIALAEELALLTAELSYLPDRRMAYENLTMRTGLEAVKSVCTALVQAERYGTPIGTALRTLSQESRDARMTEAEKKAAALPPKLTVPMILFFLPILFAVIMTPALTQAFGWK